MVRVLLDKLYLYKYILITQTYSLLQMKANFLNMALLGLGLTFFTACGGEQKQNPENTEVNQEQAAVYTCPMHPEVTSDKPGKCPECKMNLEKVAAAKPEDHTGHGH